MKKTILLFCALFALLLAACDKTPENAGTDSGNAAQSTEAGIVTGASAGTDAVSSTNAANPEPYVLKVPPEDRNQAFKCQSFVETPEGYYFGWESLIYFCPRGGDAFYPLCGKPNCNHSDENCNAWYGSAFGYYNGSLYAADFFNDFAVVKMNLDGTDHKVVAHVDISKLPQSYYLCILHHGKLFVQSIPDYGLPVEEQVNHLITLDLSDFSQTELAEDYLQAGRFDGFSTFFLDKLYVTVSSERIPDYDDEGVKLIEVDINSGAARTLIPRPVCSLYATDSTLYYYLPDMSAAGYQIENVVPGFREYDVESGTVRDMGQPVEGMTWASYDEDFIYTGDNIEPRSVYFLSRDYEVLDHIVLERNQTIFAMTSDRIFLSGVYSNSPIAFYIDKSKIGSGELEMIPIKTVK